MTPDLPESLSNTLDQLGDMTPEEAESQVRELQSSDPDFAAQVTTLWRHHISKAGEVVATDAVQLEDGAPKTKSPTTAPSPPGTSPWQAEALSSTGDHTPASVEARYQIVEELGRGSFGVVCKATDSRTGQTVALKTMRQQGGRALEFFKGEFRYLQGISHPNLGQLLQLESDGANWLIAMEFVGGGDFLDHVRPIRSGQERGLDVGRLRAALPQLVEGVAALHRHRRLHRDLKPQNVRVTPEGRVVVLDFGLAAEARPGGELRYADRSSPGTAPYMAPEQFDDLPLSSTASDFYAIGVMLYESLTGCWPYTGSVIQIVKDKATRDPVSPRELYPQAPEDLSELCMALLARRVEDRPDAEEIFRRLGHTPAHWPNVIPDRQEALLIGRDRDLDELAEAYQKSRQGEPVVVKVHGPSGIGKSVLVGQFTDGLRSQGAEVLTGRCYEHESVPYKALDPVIDELARRLHTLPDKTVEGLAPSEAGPMVKVFPVLAPIRAIGRAAANAALPPDLQEVRRRAFAGLRELLDKLATLAPLVIYIDDLQWGDIDSAYLLSDLIRPPAAPSVLWILAHRSEDADNACLQTVSESLGRSGALVREMEVNPLTEGEVGELVVRMLGEEARGRTGEIFQESRGNPYFVAELVQAIGSADEAAYGAELTLDGLIQSRVSRLPAAARQLLEVVAVSGRPLNDVDAFQTAEGISDAQTAAAQLEAGRLLRGVGAAGELELETYHDRVREAVLSGLSANIRRSHHERLAQTLEKSGRADVEQLALHFEGAGQQEKAGGYYHQAGDQAAQAVAFDQAAGFFQKALELLHLNEEGARQLRQKLGDALANAGRGGEAAPIYLTAAEGAKGIQELELRRRATDVMLMSGRTEEGMELLKELFEALGEPLPDSPEQAMERMMSEYVTRQVVSSEIRTPS